jgi:hypothetical protein
MTLTSRANDLVHAIRLLRSVCEQYNLEFEVHESGHIEVWADDVEDLGWYAFQRSV